MISLSFLKIPVTLSIIRILDPFLHEVTLARAVSTDPVFCITVSPTPKASSIKLDTVSM